MTKETGERSFDELARELASGNISRRKALKLVGGALLGGVLASIPAVEASAAPRPPKGRCPEGFVNCRGTCVKTESNPSHCGGCFTQCSPGETCCSGTCANLENDPNNCRNCGAACPPEATCQGGSGCICPDGSSPCGSDIYGTGGTCCPSDTFCAEPGLCCRSGEEACGGQCVSTTCPEGQFFNTGTCQCETSTSCPEGTIDCGGQCVSTTCPEGQTFDPGSCGCVPFASTCTEFLAICGTTPDFRSDCNCQPAVDGTLTCIRRGADGSERYCAPCTSDSDCPSTHVCFVFGTAGPICWPRCESEDPLVCPADQPA